MTRLFVKSMVLLAAFAAGLTSTSSIAGDGPKLDHLKEVASEQVTQLYIEDGVDLSQYDSLLLAVSDVKFRKNAYRSKFATLGDMKAQLEKVKSNIQVMFDHSFRDIITKKGQLKFATERSDTTLLVVPMLSEVFLTNVDGKNAAGNAATYSESVGTVTLDLYLVNSQSGRVVARFIDEQEGWDWDEKVLQTSMDSYHQFMRIFEKWAVYVNDDLIGHTP
ncbi:hypothetical protein K0504_01200 [Neiella marina]|uniref:DUF3313 domain-containing protein n=1 Tax=Neiella holothuriorum TaxID=2870530 RepID=A0ABS7ED40_9GAMM|nr:hypothetical protein [Neiella holothuriorum]MBW8189637.1 hypothetical protein [Neiella holothuriorum]